MIVLAEPILERDACDFSEKGQKKKKKGKTGQHIWKFGPKCTKFENILKKGMWLRAAIGRNKLLEKALIGSAFFFY